MQQIYSLQKKNQINKKSKIIGWGYSVSRNLYPMQGSVIIKEALLSWEESFLRRFLTVT